MHIDSLTAALWLGFLISISPCQLATSIVAISFIGRKSGSKRKVLLAGFLYLLGRALVYIILGYIITAGLYSSATISQFLQKYMNEILGPVLIIAGLFLLGWIGHSLSLNFGHQKIQARAQAGGIIWALPLGAIFSLSFCPVSAGIFFGGLLPLLIIEHSPILLPTLYALGTTFPVIVFTFIMAFATNYLAQIFDKLSLIEWWIRNITGALFILTGIYYSLIYIWLS